MNRCLLCLSGVVLFSAILVLVRIFLVSSAAYIFLLMVAYVWLVSILLSTYCFRGQKNKRALYLINFSLLYILIVSSSYAYGWFLEYKLRQFDLDADSFFSVAEQTPEQQRYMRLLINDAGRNLMAFLGAVYSGLSTAVLFAIVKMYGFFARTKKQ